MIDLDNTLGNRSVAVQSWIDEFCSERSLSPEANDWILRQDNDGYSARVDVFASIKEKYGLAESVADLVLAYQDRIIALAAATNGAIEALTELRALGHRIAIVTNGSTKQQHGKIDAIGFRDMVDAVIVSGDIGIKKPDPRIFHAAAEATGEPLSGSWMVGDSALHDIVGASALGIKTAWVHRDRRWAEARCVPTVILDDMTQLVAAIQTHA